MRDCLRADFKIKAEVITPLIIAGADNRKPDLGVEGLRPPSLRGAMRWWFRAMMGGIVGDLKALKALESEVFGSTEGASSARIRTYLRASKPGEAHLCMNDKGNRRANIRRPAFLEGSEFELCIRCEFGSSSIVLGSLWLLAMLGGVGARVRRGFGSLAMSPEDEATEKVLEDFGLSFSYPNTASLEELAEYLEESLKEIKKRFRDLASRRSALGTSSTVRFPVLSAWRARLWLIKPQHGFWAGWKEAMEDLREKVYRAYKTNQQLNEIGSASPRLASPLIIQIKRTEGGKYFGVLLAFDEGINPPKYRRYLGKNCGDFANFLGGIKGFECQEVVLP